MGRTKAEGTKIKKPSYIKKEKLIKTPIILNQRQKIECRWCKRIFSSEKTVMVHICEQKRRFDQKDSLYARYGFEAFLSIQKNCFGNIKKTEEDFRTSDFYLACIRWGRYVLDVNCFDTTGYLNWLQRLKVPIDNWNNDVVYSAWLQDLVFTENIWDAVDRSMNTMMGWAEENNSVFNNYFKEAGGARILFDVQRAKISGIILYCSDSGKEWLNNLSSSDLEIVWSVVNSSRWAVKFQKDAGLVDEVTKICNEAGL